MTAARFAAPVVLPCDTACSVLRNVGFAVFAKPKITEDSDVDEDMLAHIELRRSEGGLSHVVVASGDGRAFREPLEALVEQGVTVTVIGFREYANFALASEVIEFLDLEEIDGVFREPLPRMTLETLPDVGAWLPPFRSLRPASAPAASAASAAGAARRRCRAGCRG